MAFVYTAVYTGLVSTVVYQNGLRIWINSREAPHKGRPHCHVSKGDAEAEFDLVTLEVMANNGKFSRGDMDILKDLISLHKEELMTKWEEYHGKK